VNPLASTTVLSITYTLEPSEKVVGVFSSRGPRAQLALNLYGGLLLALLPTKIERDRYGKPTFFLRALTRGSPRRKANSGNVRVLPNRTGPSTVMRSRASIVRSLSPSPDGFES